MQLVEVIPISRAISHESLSYFTSEKVSIGSVVEIPLRSKKTKALVIDFKDVSGSKADLRSSKYKVKKILKSEPRNIFLPEFVEAAKDLADYSAASIGSVLYSLISDIVFDKVNPGKIQNNGDVHEKYVIQSSRKERFSDYRKIIRETLAKRKSAFFLAPTARLSEQSFEELKKGIKEHSYLIHSGLRKPEQRKIFQEIINSKEPVLIVSVGKFLSIPRGDIGAIIIDKEGSGFYKSKVRPFSDIRVFVEYLAAKLKARLYFGDLVLRTETIWRHKEGELAEWSPAQFKFSTPVKKILVNMKAKPSSGRDFKIASPELEKFIKKALDEKKKIFLYIARKGLHPFSVCGHCGEGVFCQRCNSPLVLHGSALSKEASKPLNKNKNFFLCHNCGKLWRAERRCAKCHSWKLIPLGIGIEFVEDRLRTHFKDLKVFKIDSDSTPSASKATGVIKEFYSARNGLLLGTEMALNFVDMVDYAGVVSMDSFFFRPDFRINEKIMNIAFSIEEKTREIFLIQTRNIEQEILKFIKEGNLAAFYRRELGYRKVLNLPPFSNLIKISFSGKKEIIRKESGKLKEFFKDYNLNVYPGVSSKVRGNEILNATLKLSREGWPDKKLREKILALPQKFRVEVNPDNLL